YSSFIADSLHTPLCTVAFIPVKTSYLHDFYFLILCRQKQYICIAWLIFQALAEANKPTRFFISARNGQRRFTSLCGLFACLPCIFIQSQRGNTVWAALLGYDAIFGGLFCYWHSSFFCCFEAKRNLFILGDT